MNRPTWYLHPDFLQIITPVIQNLITFQQNSQKKSTACIWSWLSHDLSQENLLIYSRWARQIPAAAPRSKPVPDCLSSPVRREETASSALNHHDKQRPGVSELMCSTEASGLRGVQTERAAGWAYNWSIIDCHGLQRPGKAEPHQNVKDVTADGVGHGHVSQTCRNKTRFHTEQAMLTHHADSQVSSPKAMQNKCDVVSWYNQRGAMENRT